MTATLTVRGTASPRRARVHGNRSAHEVAPFARPRILGEYEQNVGRRPLTTALSSSALPQRHRHVCRCQLRTFFIQRRASSCQRWTRTL